MGATDFKLSPGGAEQPYLVMVDLTQKSCPAQYAWFSHGRSHIHDVNLIHDSG